MKFGVVNKFVLHTIKRNITHLAVITRKTKIKLGILKGGNWKRAAYAYVCHSLNKNTQNFVATGKVYNTFFFKNSKVGRGKRGSALFQFPNPLVK